MRGFFGAFGLATLLAGGGAAQASECFQMARGDAPLLHRATMTLATEEVSVRFVAHSSYLLENAEGLRIATDWSGDFAGRIDGAPDVVTMNHAHSTHWTPNPDPEIDHPLQGWGEKGQPRRHFLRLGETLIRNVPTDIRGGYAGIEPFGNSIFIFEIGDLCVGHLGHIQHEPTEEQYALLGRLDVVMVPVDGMYTIGVDDAIPMLKRLKAQVVLPMHSFGPRNLSRFLTGMGDEFAVEYMDGDTMTLSQKRLPDMPTIFVPKSL